ncbi:MAG: type II secretion system protein, partial [Patescibacteria group bacterium]
MRGFTMVEMLVSLGIILVITSIVLLGQNSFNKNLVVIDTTYTVEFTLRQAQTLALSSRKAGAVQNAGYGVHFANGSMTSYSLFADTIPAAPGNGQGGRCPGHGASSGLESRPGNCLYDDTTEIVTTYNLNHGFKASRFCG